MSSFVRRRTTVAFALALVLAKAAPALAQDSTSEDSIAEDATAEGAATEDSSSASEPRDHTYALGLGFVESRFRTEESYAMGMLGPSLVFDYAVGRRFGFGVHGSMNFPMHGRLRYEGDAEGVNLVSMYDKRLSIDAMFMFVHRIRPTETVDIVLGGGIHVHTLRLVDQTYNAVELISGGFGGLARIEVRFADRFFYAGQATAAFDPLDFVKHIERAVYVAPISLSFSVGVRR